MGTQKTRENGEDKSSETRATSTTSRKSTKEEKPASAKNEEKRGASAVSKKVSSASSSKKGSEAGLNRAEAVKTAEKNGRVPTGKQERPPTTSAEATEENKEQSASEDIRKSQATPVILEQDVERVKTKIKTGEDIDAHEILRPVLFMLDDMRRNIRHIRKKNGHKGEMEVVNGDENVQTNDCQNGQNFRHSLMNVNVKDINKNIGALQMYTQLKTAPSFIVTTSTMTADIKEAKIEGYLEPIFRARTKSKQGAGIGIYARSDYAMNISERMKNVEYKVKNIEFLGVEASYEVEDSEEPKKLLVVGIYRPNGKSPRDILKELEIIFQTALATKLPLIVAGDFNIDASSTNDGMAKKYIALLEKHGLKMQITEPTRINCKSSALVDHILTNDQMDAINGTVLDLKIAEHQVSIAEWN